MTGKYLKRLRTKVLQMTQIEFAEEIGTTRETIGRWENGKHTIRLVYERAIRELEKRRGVA